MPAPSPASLVDWVDAADRPIDVVPRDEVFHRQAGFRVAHIFVFNEDGDLLLQQLGRKRERNPLRWGSSVAGYLSAGESYYEGAVRRLREELGAEAPLAKFGSVLMPDQGARKFITLYVTRGAVVKLADTNHIESLRFESLPAIQDWMLRTPGDFTETFRFLFQFYRSTAQLIDSAG